MNQKAEVRTISLPDLSMDYITFGQGKRPLVILPGISLKSVMLSAQAIAAAFADFTATHTVYLFDRRRDIREGETIMHMADDTACVMRALGIADADLFGASQGGMIALCMAICHPELVHRMVLGSTMARPNSLAAETIARWITLARSGDPVPLNRDFFARVYTPSYRETYREAFSAMERDGTPEELHRFAILAEACLTFDVHDRLGEIRCPTLVLGAAEDQVLSSDASLEIARALACACYMYAHYGHAVYDEAPDYRARMKRFLDAAEND